MLRSFIIEVLDAHGTKTDVYRVTLGDPLRLAVERLYEDAVGKESWRAPPGNVSTGTLCAMVMQWLLGRDLRTIASQQSIGSIKVISPDKLEHFINP